MARCGSCDAEIIWAVLVKSGRRIPLNPEPVPGGNIELSKDQAIATTVTPGTKPLHISHFATCPNAAEHRRAR